MDLCTHFAHLHHNIHIPFVSFMHPKDTVNSTRKMLFYLSVSSLSKLQHLTYSRCLVNNCGLNKSFWTPEWPLFRKPPTFLGCWVSWGRVSEDLQGAVSQQLVFYIFCLQGREIIKELLLTCYEKWKGSLTFMWLGNPKTKKKREMRLFRHREALVGNVFPLLTVWQVTKSV